MSWPMGQSCPKCDECGRFIPFEDLQTGEATHATIMPDSEFSSEVDESICKDCWKKEAHDE